MAIWVLKAVVQKTISFMPYKFALNRLFQKHVTKGLDLTDTLFASKIHHLGQHLEAYAGLPDSATRDLPTLELGTGWYPVVPVGLFLSGMNNITTVDIQPLLSADHVRDTVKMYLQWIERGEFTARGINLQPDRIDVLHTVLKMHTLDEMLSAMHIEYCVRDVSSVVGEKQIAFVHSNNTLEHVYPADLQQMLKVFNAKLKSDAIMSHFIDLSDHFSHMDARIGPLNFLRFSDRQWRFIDNTIQPQNRLRIADYRNLFKLTGWSILKEQNETAAITDLIKSQINAKFVGYTDQDVSVTHSWVVLKKNGYAACST